MAGVTMEKSLKNKNKAIVLEAFNTLFNRRDYAAAESFWSPDPPTLKYEPGTIVADGEFVIVHGRFSGFQAVSWIAADILRIKDGLLVEHWDLIQDEATKEGSKSGQRMFGTEFPRQV